MNTGLRTPLPEAVVRYFESANHFDATAAAECFTTDASVRDEEQNHIGTEAIKAWVSQTGSKYQPQVTVKRVREEGNKLVLTASVTGQFPGSPVELEYHLCLDNGKIAELTIQ